MSVRTKEQIEELYSIEAAHVGDMEFKIKLLKAQAEKGYEKLAALNEEARLLKVSESSRVDV